MAACGTGEHVKTHRTNVPLSLELGGVLPGVTIAYETWGTLRQFGDGRTNAVLICHALTGDSHVARHGSDDKPGWWDLVVGPGKHLDTDELFVICSNTLGGCSGTTGPGDVNPATDRPWAASFPAITQRDAVAVQRRLVDHLGIDRLAAVIGGSMGGQQALQWALDSGECVDACVLLATSPCLSSQALAFDIVGRNAILRDPAFHDGDYHDHADEPRVGLALARMLAHITYLSRDGMTAKFDPERDKPRDLDGDFARSFEANFGVGSYLAHQGDKFVERFDANSYVALTRAMDRFDLGRSIDELAGRLANETHERTRFAVASFSSDWLFPPEQSRQIVGGLSRAGRHVSYVEITSNGGHDAFLLPAEVDQYGGFIRSICRPSPESTPASDATPRPDHDAILSLIDPGDSVLDLGCGDGSLLLRLREQGQPTIAGIDVATDNVLAATARGLDVMDADLNTPREFFRDGQFDVVVLSQALQNVENTLGVMREMLRVGRRAIVSFPNFAHAPLRRMLADEGRSPKADGPYAFEWYDSPNRRFPTIADFHDLCDKLGLVVQRGIYLDTHTGRTVDDEPNLHADLAVVVVATV
ncbi:MAG: homoserine O-acetyltransferase [Planctomycetota bacterium]